SDTSAAGANASPRRRNGNKPAAAPVIPVPVHAPAEPEEEPSWGDLLATNDSKTEGRGARGEGRGGRSRPSSIILRPSKRRLGLIIALASFLVLGMICAVGALVWLLNRPSGSATSENLRPVVIYVNPKRVGDSLPSV